MRPTGKLHLGHLVGALHNWVRLQDEYDCFYFVADWHALTSDYADTDGDRRPTRSTTSADWIAAGLDPERSHDLRPVARARARRAVPAALDDRRRSRGSSACRPTRSSASSSRRRTCRRIGFLGYPLLQTADITIYDAQLRAGGRGPGAAPRAVARGRAPLQQLLRRGLRRAAAAAHDRSPRLPGLDNRKMSKSYGNAIDLSDDAEDGAEEGDADVHGPEAGPRRHPGHRRGQPGVHLPRRLQPERRRRSRT